MYLVLSPGPGKSCILSVTLSVDCLYTRNLYFLNFFFIFFLSLKLCFVFNDNKKKQEKYRKKGSNNNKRNKLCICLCKFFVLFCFSHIRYNVHSIILIWSVFLFVVCALFLGGGNLLVFHIFSTTVYFSICVFHSLFIFQACLCPINYGGIKIQINLSSSVIILKQSLFTQQHLGTHVTFSCFSHMYLCLITFWMTFQTQFPHTF